LRRRVDLELGAEEIARWFDARLPGGGRLGRQLGEEAPVVRRFLEQRLAGQSLPRLMAVAIVAAERPTIHEASPRRERKSKPPREQAQP
jgi:hypothetical protein